VRAWKENPVDSGTAEQYHAFRSAKSGVSGLKPSVGVAFFRGGRVAMTRVLCSGLMVCALSGASGRFATAAGQKPAPPPSPRVYVFDCGDIKGLDPALFRFKKEEVASTDFVVTCYLIAHPRGTLMWDVGVIPDSAFKSDGKPVTEGRSTVTRPLKAQMAAAGYSPADITYLALSHYHSDHTANANDFAGATWIVQQAERDFMFGDKPAGIVKPEHYSALRNSKTIVLRNEDHDVFGDGTVVLKSTPGHTPGHQVLFVRLAKTGPLCSRATCITIRRSGRSTGFRPSSSTPDSRRPAAPKWTSS